MSEAARPASLKLSPSEREAIAHALKRHGGAEQRRDKRTDLDDSFQLLIRVGTGQLMSVTPRDISSSGLGFYHVAYVHPGTAISMVMKAKGHDAVTRKGTVVRCRHVSGRVHEVGVLFEEKVEVGIIVTTNDIVGQQPEPTRKLDTNELYAKISELSEKVGALSTERAELDSILQRVGELAQLLMEQGRTQPAKPAAGDKAKPGATASGGGHAPSRH